MLCQLEPPAATNSSHLNASRLHHLGDSLMGGGGETESSFHNNEEEVLLTMLDKVHKNIMFLAEAADLQINSRFALRENRELISKEDLHDFFTRFP